MHLCEERDWSGGLGRRPEQSLTVKGHQQEAINGHISGQYFSIYKKHFIPIGPEMVVLGPIDAIYGTIEHFSSIYSIGTFIARYISGLSRH